MTDRQFELRDASSMLGRLLLGLLRLRDLRVRGLRAI